MFEGEGGDPEGVKPPCGVCINYPPGVEAAVRSGQLREGGEAREPASEGAGRRVEQGCGAGRDAAAEEVVEGRVARVQAQASLWISEFFLASRGSDIAICQEK